MEHRRRNVGASPEYWFIIPLLAACKRRIYRFTFTGTPSFYEIQDGGKEDLLQFFLK